MLFFYYVIKVAHFFGCCSNQEIKRYKEMKVKGHPFPQILMSRCVLDLFAHIA